MRSYKIIEIAVLDGTPSSTPAEGFRYLYPKGDGWYMMDPNGNEVKLGDESGTITEHLNDKDNPHETDSETVLVNVTGFTGILSELDSDASVQQALEELDKHTTDERGTKIITAAESGVVAYIEAYLGDTETGNRDLLLPDPTTVQSLSFTFRHFKGANALTIMKTSGKIVFDGIEYDLMTLENNGEWATIKEYNGNYYLIADSGLDSTAFDNLE